MEKYFSWLDFRTYFSSIIFRDFCPRFYLFDGSKFIAYEIYSKNFKIEIGDSNIWRKHE